MPGLIRTTLSLLLFHCLSLFITGTTAVAQSGQKMQELPFELLTIEDGLSQGMVNCILQDHYGFMWFGTKDGLNRYDGRRFKVYKHEPADTNHLRDNHIQQVYEDSQKRLWIGTSRQGIALMDREKEHFHHILFDTASSTPSKSNFIINIEEDGDKNLWVGTLDGLFKITFTGKGKRGSLLPDYIIKKYFGNHCNFHITRNGTLYGSAERVGPFTVDPDAAGNDRTALLPPSTHYWAPGGMDDFLQYTAHIMEDTTRNKVWYFYEFCFVEVDLQTQEARVRFRRTRNIGGLTYKAIVDNQGMFWIVTAGTIEKFDPETGGISYLTARDPKLKPAAESLRHIYMCRSGIVWIGTMGYGILKYNTSAQKFNEVPSASLGCMQPLDNGRIIAIMPLAFLSTFDKKTNTFTTYMHDTVFLSRMNMAATRATFSAARDNDGIFWLCKERLVRYDATTGDIRVFPNINALGIPMYMEPDGAIWFGSLKSFTRYHTRTDEVYEWEYPFPVTNDPYIFMQSLYRDGEGNFWLGTNNGLLFFNPVTEQWRNYTHHSGKDNSLSNNIVFSILPDPTSPGILWIGTSGGGLNRMDTQTGTFTHITEADGLPNNVVYGILSDNQHRLWMSTNRGLSRYDPASNTFRNFDARDGLQGNEFNRYAYCKDADGTFFFGGVNGLNYFHPDSIRDNPVKPVVVITGVKLKNENVDFKEGRSPLSRPPYLTDAMQIRYRDNMITFEFAALEFSAPLKNRYRYHLDGFDQEWIEAGNTNTAVYTNLDPGEYVFRVMGSNNDGIWGESEARLRLVILPPWYMTWWFRIAAVLIVLGGLYGLYRFRLNQAMQLQQLRNRIASDLHDEIGSTLSSISLYGTAAKKMLRGNDDAAAMLSKINESTSNMMEAMSDIVWTIDTRHDGLDELINKMREFAVHIMEARGCDVHFTEHGVPEDHPLNMNQRKNIYLIFKEAVNNAAKYSECRNLYVDFHFSRQGFIMQIRDDGKGFDPGKVLRGNGLMNMRQRAAGVGGTLTLDAAPGQGTRLELRVKV